MASIDVKSLGISKSFTGRVKYKDKYYIFEKGHLAQGKYKYIVTTKKGIVYGASPKGKMLTGLHVIRDKFYYFRSDGSLNHSKTDKIRKLSKRGTSLHKFVAVAGKPKSSKYYGGSCYHHKGQKGLKDGDLTYKHFVVHTCKLANGHEIIVDYE